VTVGAGATLSGTGVIGGLIAQSGSTIAPGTSPGILSVAGNVTLQAGSTSVFEISASGPSDLILATGTATLGGTASLVNLGGDYAFGSTIVLIAADGGLSGAFDAVTSTGFGTRYRPELVFSGDEVRMLLAPNSFANIIGTTAISANQRAVVEGIDAAVSAGYNPQALSTIYDLPTAQLPGAIDQLSGEAYATAAGVGIEQERMVREAVLGRANAVALAARGAPEAASGFGVWGQLLGGWGDGESEGNAAAIETDRTGFVTGLDYGTAGENGHWRAGLFGMRMQSDVTIAARGSTAEVQQAGGGAYAAFGSGGFAAVIGGYLAEVDLRTFRDIALLGFADSLVGTTEGKARQAFGELSYTLEVGKGMIRPFVAGAFGSFRLDALTERGGPAALEMREQRYETGSLTGGIDAALPIARLLRLEGTLAARTQLGDRDPQAQLALAAAPQQTFAVSGVQLDKTALAARLDATLTLEDNLAISLGYSGLIGSTTTDHGARASVHVRF
jgi:outer membrane autotransporter protein